MLNGLVPDQDRRSVSPDLGPICLQRRSADDKIWRWQETAHGTMQFSIARLSFMRLLSSADFFQNYLFQRNKLYWNTEC